MAFSTIKRRYLLTTTLLAIYASPVVSAAGIDACWSPSPETLALGARREWIQFGDGSVSNADNFFPICSLDNVAPEDPPGVKPLYLAPRPIDIVSIGSSRSKERDAHGWPTAKLGPLVGTITLDGGAYRDVAVWALNEADRAIVQVPGVVDVEGFSFAGLPDASNLSIRGGGTVNANKFGVLGGADVVGGISVTSVPQSGSLLTTPDLMFLGGNLRTKSGDILIAGGAGSKGTVTIPDTADGELRRLDLEHGSQGLFVARDGVGSMSLGANSQVTAGVVVIGAEQHSAGSVAVHGGAQLLATRNPRGSVNVGGKGLGHLTLQPDAVVRSSGDMILASETTGQGKVEMHPGSELTLGSDQSDAGALRIGGFDRGFGAGGKAEFLVHGGRISTKNLVIVGAAEEATGAFHFFDQGELNLRRRLIVGHAGVGQMSIQGSAKVTIENPDGDEGLRIGRWETGKGHLLLSGRDARLEGLGKRITVGLLGTGTLEVDDGFQLDMAGGNVVLGQEVGSLGSLVVAGAGSGLTSKELHLGERGIGHLRVTEGAVVKTQLVATIGEGEGPAERVSTALVEGAGTRWEIGGDSLGALLLLGGSSEARLTIQDGGTVEIKAPGLPSTLSIAQSAGSKGVLRIDGADSRLSLPGSSGGVFIGGGGEAVVEVINGAQLTLAGTTGGGSGLELGLKETAKSSILVQDGGARIDLDGPLTIGVNGVGELLLRDSVGASQTAERAAFRTQGPLVIGAGRGGRGVARIDGRGATLKVGANVTIGEHGSGELRLLRGGNLNLEGGLFEPRRLTLGKEPLSSGLLELSGSALNVSQMDVGLSGHAELKVVDGGSLTVDDVLQVGGVSPTGRGTASIAGETTQVTVGTLELGRRKNAVFGQGEPSLDLGEGAKLSSTHTRIGGDGSASYRVHGKAVWRPGTVRIGGLDTGKSVGLALDSDIRTNSLEITAIGDHELTLDQGAQLTPSLLGIGREGNGRAVLTLKGRSRATVAENRTLIGSAQVAAAELHILEGSLFETSELRTIGRSTVNVDGNESKLAAGLLILEEGSRVTLDHGASLAVDDFSASQGDTRIVVRGQGHLRAQRLGAEFLEAADRSLVEIAGSLDVGTLLVTGESRIAMASDESQAWIKDDAVWKISEGSSMAVAGFLTMAGDAPFLEVGGNSDLTVARVTTLKSALIHGAGTRLETSSLGIANGVTTFAQGAQGEAADVLLLNAELNLTGAAHISVARRIVGAGSADRLDVRGGSVTVGAANPMQGAVVVGPGGSFVDEVQIRGNLVMAGGRLMPGSSPGQIRVDGDVLIEPGSVLDIEFAGLAPGEFDLVQATGDIDIEAGAVLNLMFIEGFAPAAGDVIDFLRAGADFTGAFSEIQISGLEQGWEYQLNVTDEGSLQLRSLSDGVPTSAKVPEPASLFLSLAGVAALGRGRAGGVRRRCA